MTTKRVVLSSGDAAASGASSEEVALAGKGFSEDVEREYRSQTDLDFTWVDEMEGYGVETEALVVFLEDGELTGVIQ